MLAKYATLAVGLACSAVMLQTAMAAEAPGGAPPQSATYQPAAMQGDPNEVVCKEIVKTGTRARTDKVCMTRLDWEIQDKAAKDTTEKWQRNSGPQQGH